ncbi:primase C-terminal domain-containing protein [Desulfitobacterium chlororespirans]|uniref:Primase C terminal 1 (PriCT-1) n=1 Tax=Desulfitobacterium chlororespirans DSM 11544 TaxID=1121395 RepID=A0A1M7UY24_9FIRM|nr:primase C-terminal domain-containing protein [Desulfitobacterium chlororespirans]SHN87893.1 Primase C terminal 1 (PriCT-1) [Desulfitobacterium chlororespirans DSM 11544]
MLSDVFCDVLPETSPFKVIELGTNHGFVFGSNIKSDSRILWTVPELETKGFTYVTAATFFGRKRQRRYVRHVLAFVCDFDTPVGTTPEEIIDLYYAAGLPLPELIVATATPGHYQAWNILDEPLRLSNDLLRAKTSMIHDAMIEALGADPCAVGVERWVRRPTVENTVYVDDFSRTSWDELCDWYEARRPVKAAKAKTQKVVYIGTLLATPAGRRIQEPVAEKGERNRWAYGLGLCLWDAGVPVQEIHTKMHEWNKGLQKPLTMAEVEKIYRSVLTGRHHASPRVLSSITGLSAQIKGWYKWAKPRDRRRDHVSEVKEDIIGDLLSHGSVHETQKAWAERLGVAYRTLKLAIAQLRKEGSLEAATGRGKYAQSSYNLSEGYLNSLVVSSAELPVAAGAEGLFSHGVLKGHTAISPLKGISTLCGEVVPGDRNGSRMPGIKVLTEEGCRSG